MITLTYYYTIDISYVDIDILTQNNRLLTFTPHLLVGIRRFSETPLSFLQCWPHESARTLMVRESRLRQVACTLPSYISMVMNNVLNLPGNSSRRRCCIPGWRAASILGRFGIWPPASSGWQVFAFFRDHFQRTIRWSFIVHNLVYMVS